MAPGENEFDAPSLEDKALDQKDRFFPPASVSEVWR